jgi:ATP-dependent DNA helicase RecG
MLRPPELDPLFAGVDSLKGVGPQLVKVFARLLEGRAPSTGPRVLDLVLHLPAATIDRRERTTIARSVVGTIATMTVRVESHRAAPRGRPNAPARILTSDDTGDLVLVYFGRDTEWALRLLPVGETRIVSGTVEIFDGIKQMVHPDHVVAPENAVRLPAVEAIYPLTEGLSGRVLARAIEAALQRVPPLAEWLPDDAARLVAARPFKAALETLHRPPTPEDAVPDGPAMRRLALDELLADQVALALLRTRMVQDGGRVNAGDGAIVKRLLAALPYALTGAQTRAVAEIHADMAKPERMVRLLQGDVGAGKTVVALLAMARAAESGRQSALMAPTEILARQHAATITPLAAAAGLGVAILTGREKGATRRAILDGLANGSIPIVVGTHALVQVGVVFHDLGLAVVDEQHRFGVQQRLALAEKGGGVDLLVTTATPIPRTLVLTYYGDMDASRLDEKPPGRLPIDTRAVPLDRLDEVVGAVGRAVSGGARIYWICPLVEESEKVDLVAAEERHAMLATMFGPRVGLLHGRMRGADKDAALAAFARGDTDVLVSTTVVEVGVDVPEASVMVIEHAERFGLAQLHQLRGRIGRGAAKSTCLLLYASNASQVARERLQVIRDSEDGFAIAEADLKLRGPGEVLGTRQAGLPATRIVRWEHHADLVAPAREAARRIVAEDPTLSSPRGAATRALLYLFGKAEALRLVDAG